MHLLVDVRHTEPAKVTVQPTSCPPKSMHTSFKIVPFLTRLTLSAASNEMVSDSASVFFLSN